MRNPHVRWKANKQFAFSLQTPSGSLFSPGCIFSSSAALAAQCDNGCDNLNWLWLLLVLEGYSRRLRKPLLLPLTFQHTGSKSPFLNEAGKWKWSFQPSDTSPSQQLSMWKWRVGLIFLLQNNEQQQKTNKQKTRSPRYLTKFTFIYTLKNSLVPPTSHSTKLYVGNPAHTWSIDLLAGNIRKWWGGRGYSFDTEL